MCLSVPFTVPLGDIEFRFVIFYNSFQQYGFFQNVELTLTFAARKLVFQIWQAKIDRKTRSFKDKLKLIEDNNNKQTTQRKLAAKYGVSKSQVQRVLTNKENIL